MKAVHLREQVSIPYADLQLCNSSAQVVYLKDTVAQKVVNRLGNQIINSGFVVDFDNKVSHEVNIIADLYVIPPEYKGDILRFAQDVVKAHEEQQVLDATG